MWPPIKLNRLKYILLIVYANENTRFDIILQHEQHWYLRASTPAERQKWLIAIGTIKAGSIESRTRKEKGK